MHRPGDQVRTLEQPQSHQPMPQPLGPLQPLRPSPRIGTEGGIMRLNLENAIGHARVGSDWPDPARRDNAAPPWAQGGTTTLGGSSRAQSGVARSHPTGGSIGSQKHQQNQVLVEGLKRSTAFLRLKYTWAALATATLLAGCASVQPDGASSAALDLAQPALTRLGGPPNRPSSTSPEEVGVAVEALLAQKPLSMDNAVRVALLNSPRVAQSMAQLRISDAERVQAATLPNPHLAIARAVEGDKLMRERAIGFNLFGMLALPWRAEWAGQQAEVAKLQAAQEVLRTAADARKAWIAAVAAKQSAAYAADSKVAAEAAGELARRMASVGNWSKLNQARVQVALADATTAQARSENSAVLERERLIRVLGLWGQQTQFELPERLPDLPKSTRDATDIEAQALRQRLDVRAAIMQADAVGKSLGLTKAAGFINALDLKLVRESTLDGDTGDVERKRMWELELPIPIFDWGSAANARAQGSYMQSVAALQQVAVAARSEARETYHSYRTAHDVALHYRDEIVPLRKFIQNETLLRYNGMLIGVFELIADARVNIAAVNSSLGALRDFWLIETDLHMVLAGTSPGGISALKTGPGAQATQDKGH